MAENIEQGFKWWIRYVVVPLIVALIGGGGVCGLIFAIIQNNNIPTSTPTTSSDNLLQPATLIPTSITPTSPVVGTQIYELYDIDFYAVLVGVTDQTDFSLSDASNYTYMASVTNVDDAVIELSKMFSQEEIIYVVHVPELRVTPGNPGSCKLYMKDVKKLEQYPLGWIIGGDNIVPDQFEDSLAFCFTS